MATTNSTSMVGKAIGGQRGNGNHGRHSLKAKLAASAAILGCAAALAFGGLRAGDNARSPSVAPATSFAQSSGVEQQRFLEVNTQLPDGTLPIARISAERQRFLEWNLYLPDGGASTRSSDRSTLR